MAYTGGCFIGIFLTACFLCGVSGWWILFWPIMFMGALVGLPFSVGADIKDARVQEEKALWDARQRRAESAARQVAQLRTQGNHYILDQRTVNLDVRIVGVYGGESKMELKQEKLAQPPNIW